MIGSSIRDCTSDVAAQLPDRYNKESIASCLETGITSFLAGSGAKMCVNNANRTVARYQLGNFKADLTLKSFRSQLLGASLQSLGVFGGRELLGAGEKAPETAAELAKDFSKNFAAGVLGGLMMHPCCIPFYFLPAEKHKQGLLPNYNALKAVLSDHKGLMMRGVVPRGISTGIEFGVYFTMKNALKEHIDNPVVLEAVSSLPAILGAVPFHQRYIDAMNGKTQNQRTELPKTRPDPLTAVRMPTVASLLTRHQKAFIMFTMINMTELAILDALKNYLSEPMGLP
jgi:hypothetical protein